jgi:hypothetical protein
MNGSNSEGPKIFTTEDTEGTEKIHWRASYGRHSIPTQCKSTTTNGYYFIYVFDCCLWVPTAGRTATGTIGLRGWRCGAEGDPRAADDADR